MLIEKDKVDSRRQAEASISSQTDLGRKEMFLVLFFLFENRSRTEGGVVGREILSSLHAH